MINIIKVIIGASAGGPQALKKLFSFNKEINYPIILAMHNLSNQTENFKKYVENISNQKVHIVKNLKKIHNGIYIPDGGKDLIFFNKNTLTVSQKSDVVAPSINHLFESLALYADENTYVFLLGGLGNDGSKGLKFLEKTRTIIYIQKDAQFPYMTKNAMNAISHYIQMNLEDMNRVLIQLNEKIKNEK
ncbi:chemotaxis protein CheB [Marinitoga lauensis]|uniref:chemotaxis protein CheB n=1 Tax=Marinitoga lauensis TaxID=2201189 RepID=UPI0010125CDD|nr:chemotaxis protein CheB [Marinitoga lauensis]